MNSDCYEKGHTPDRYLQNRAVCRKCFQDIFCVRVDDAAVWHTQAELDRLWKGVDREAARSLTGGERHGSV